jgi:perosamine synthetase
MQIINRGNRFIPWSRPHFWGREKEYVSEAMDSMWLSGGGYLEKLSFAFSELLQMKHALLTSNGTTALHLIYLALELQEGDEIIIPGFGFLAAANIASQIKLKPIFAEVNSDTWCLTASDIQSRLSHKTKAVVAIHTYGNVCEMESILSIARSKKIAVIEDCAESLFSKYRGHYCGTFGDLNSFSFQATKTITTGEGGMVVTNQSKWHHMMELYHSHGLIQRGTYQHKVPGHNFRLTNLQAALGLAQFEQRQKIIAERQRVFNQYRSFFQNQTGIELQAITPGAEPVWWAFAIKLDEKAFPQGRDIVIEELKNQGIETRPGFTASSMLQIYPSHKLPVCEKLSHNILSLPSFAGLRSEEIDYISQKLMKLKK